MNSWDMDPQYLAGAWRHLFARIRLARKQRREPRPVGSCPAMG